MEILREGSIQFHFVDTSFYFPNRTKLKGFLLGLFKSEGYRVNTINYIFCKDDYLLQLNRKYLKHNTYTDIITFELSKGEEPIIADIYISMERVKENSRLFHSLFLKELHRVIFHGALHLCGYKDKLAKDIKQIRIREDFYLNRYFVSRET